MTREPITARTYGYTFDLVDQLSPSVVLESWPVTVTIYADGNRRVSNEIPDVAGMRELGRSDGCELLGFRVATSPDHGEPYVIHDTDTIRRVSLHEYVEDTCEEHAQDQHFESADAMQCERYGVAR